MPLRRCWSAVVLILLAVPPAEAQTDAVVRVTPGGPVGSLEEARDKVRELRKGQAARTPVTVRFAAGTYRMTGPVAFGPEDGGVVYEAEPGAKVVLDGGREIKGFTKVVGGLWADTTSKAAAAGGKPFEQVYLKLDADPKNKGPVVNPKGNDSLWAVKVPEFAAKAGRKPFEQLYVNGRRAVRARTPNEGYFYIKKRAEPEGVRSFIGRREDLSALDGRSADELRDANLVVYHSWEVSRHRIAKVDGAKGLVELTGPAPWPFLKWGANQRYHLENLRAALDAPGEWFLQRDGILLYKPLPGETPETTRAVTPVAEAFVSIQGDPDKGAFVEDLAFRGLIFRHSAYSLPKEGHGDHQAASSIPAVIMVDAARRVEIKDCRIEHVGIYGVWFRRGCSDCKLEHTALTDLGAGGVRIGEASMPAKPAYATGKVTVDDCIIRGYGRWFPGAIGVWIGQSSDNKIVHNDIADGCYTTVSVGWSWGYKPTDCKRNTIDYNRLHHLGRNVLSDMGGVYTLGLSEGTSISHNVIHDVDSYVKSGAGGWGLYNDEGSTGIVLEGNLVYDTTTGSYHQHYGRENVVRNNILAFSKYGQVMRSRPEEHLSFTVENNIIYWKGGPLLTGNWKDSQHYRIDSNLYYEGSGATVDFPGGLSLEAWRKQARQDERSKVADPLFENADARDFRLKAGSPAASVGFKPFDFNEAGVRGDGAWRKEADAPLPASTPAPEPPAMSVADDFEEASAGTSGYTPDSATMSDGGRPELVAITEEAAAQGRRSLKIADAAGLKNGFDPHFYFQPHYKKGLATCSFAIRTEPGAVFYHEWRDGSTPYKVGPSVWFRDGKLVVGGKPVMDVRPGDWLRVEVSARLGENSSKPTWNLTVARPGAQPLQLKDLPASPGWKSADWVGFSSSATAPTAVLIDDLKLQATP